MGMGYDIGVGLSQSSSFTGGSSTLGSAFSVTGGGGSHAVGGAGSGSSVSGVGTPSGVAAWLPWAIIGVASLGVLVLMYYLFAPKRR